MRVAAAVVSSASSRQSVGSALSMKSSLPIGYVMTEPTSSGLDFLGRNATLADVAHGVVAHEDSPRVAGQFGRAVVGGERGEVADGRHGASPTSACSASSAASEVQSSAFRLTTSTMYWVCDFAERTSTKLDAEPPTSHPRSGRRLSCRGGSSPFSRSSADQLAGESVAGFLCRGS